jgi:hypothetical protein
VSTLQKPGVIIHAFFVAKHARDKESAAGKTLVDMWERVGADLDMQAAFPGPNAWPTALRLNRIGTAPGLLTVLAGVRREVPGEVHEALAYQLHDVVGISILVGSDDTEPASWPRAADGWFDGWTQRTEGVLGAATVHVGLTTDQRHAKVWSTAPDWIADVLLEQPPPEWGRSWWRPVRELVLWELTVPPPADPVLTRRMLAMAARSDEPVTEDWFWSDSRHPQALPPFTAYLLHAAKMRYERAVLEQDIEAMGKLAAAIGVQSTELASALSREKRSIGDILKAERVLSRLRWGNDGLSDVLSRVRDMTQTVRVAQANIKSSLLGSPPGKSGSPVETDRQLGRWTLQQLIVLEAYLDSAQRRAAEMQRLASVEIDQVLQDRRENLVVVQTAVIGAILMALAGIQSIGYKVDWLPGELQAPTIFLLAALALMLPSAVLRWPRGGGGDAAFAWFDVMSAGVLGSTVGWFVVSLGFQILAGGGAPAWASLLAAASVAFCTALTAMWLLRRKVTAEGDS